MVKMTMMMPTWFAWLSWQYCIWKTTCHARSRGFLRGGAIQRGDEPNKAGRGKSLGGGEALVVWVIKVATGGAHVECVLIAWVTWGGPGACSPGKVLHLSPLKWLEINVKNKNGVVKLGILSTSKNVAIKKPVSTKRMVQQQLFSKPSTFFDKKIIAVIDATFAVAKRKPEKNSGLYGIRTLDLCHTGL